MAEHLMLPHWGMELTEGTIVRWLKREGDAVSKGDPLVEIETEKANGELESPYAGVLARILVREGATVSVGTALAVIAQPGERIEAAAPPTQAHAPATPVTRTAAVASSPAAQVEPVARRFAQDKGIDLAQVTGTGPQGRITLADVQRVAEAKPSAGAVSGQWRPMAGHRLAIAKRMLRSSQESAPVTLMLEADVTALEEQRRAMRAQGIDRLAVYVKAAALALAEHPQLNGHVRSFDLDLRREVNIGVAVGLDDGIAVPVVRGADSKTLQEITREIREKAAQARQGRLAIQDASGGTFTLTNLAPEGIDAFTPTINPPEIAILGIGRTREKPAVHRGEIAKRAMLWLSLTFDHRATDGSPASRFLRAIAARLEDPAWLGLA